MKLSLHYQEGWGEGSATGAGKQQPEIRTACSRLPLWKIPQQWACVFHEAAQDMVSGRCITISRQAWCWIRLFIASEVTKRQHSLSFSFKYETEELLFSQLQAPNWHSVRRSMGRSGIEQGLGFCTLVELLHSFLLSPAELSEFSLEEWLIIEL